MVHSEVTHGSVEWGRHVVCSGVTHDSVVWGWQFETLRPLAVWHQIICNTSSPLDWANSVVNLTLDMVQWLDVKKTKTNCPSNRRAISAGNCVNARTESVIGHYGQMMSSALRRASAVNTRPSSAEMTALSVATFHFQLYKQYYCCVIILFIATASLSEYDVNKNVIIGHKCVQCVLTYVNVISWQSPLPFACVCDVLPQLVLHYKTKSNDSFTSSSRSSPDTRLRVL